MRSADDRRVKKGLGDMLRLAALVVSVALFVLAVIFHENFARLFAQATVDPGGDVSPKALAPR
jgi:hypothetical protein